MDQEQIGVMQSPMYHYGSAIMYLTNPENELTKLEMTLRNAELDRDGNMVQIPGTEPLLNEYGIKKILGMLGAIVNQVTVMSNLDRGDIDALMEFLNRTLAKDLMINRKKYDIKDPASRTTIHFEALSTAFITMKRAHEEGLSDKKFWRGSVTEIHNKIEGADKRKGGVLSKLNPFKA